MTTIECKLFPYKNKRSVPCYLLALEPRPGLVDWIPERMAVTSLRSNPTIFLPSGVHTKPKPKTKPEPKPKPKSKPT